MLVVLKLLQEEHRSKSYSRLAEELGMSPSEVHAGVKRLNSAGLLVDREPVQQALCNFVVHGLRHVFIAERGGLTRGIPTAYAARPLSEIIVASDDPPPVWPDPEGDVKGEAISPLYTSVPKAVRQDAELGELLALVDGIRIGRARERTAAERLFRERACPKE